MRIIGGCHCGATRFELAHPPESVTSCNCTNCSKRGVLWAYYKPSDVTITQEMAEGVYQWAERIGRYHFCLHCGCSTYAESPDYSSGEADFDNPIIAVNARLIDEFDPATAPVTMLDGRNLW